VPLVEHNAEHRVPDVPCYGQGPPGVSHHETVTIGGQTPEGLDATNELSYVLLESTRPLRMSYPELGVRIHANTPTGSSMQWPRPSRMARAHPN